MGDSTPVRHAKEDTAKNAASAGRWLAHLCQEQGASGRKLTHLEQLKLDEFIRLYGQLEVFRSFYIQAVLESTSEIDYVPTAALLEKYDTESQVLRDEPCILQRAVKAVRIHPLSLCVSVAETEPRLVGTIRLLIDYGAVVNSLDQDGNSALFYVCVLGYYDLFVSQSNTGAEIRTEHEPWTLNPTQEQKEDGYDQLDAPKQTSNLLEVTLNALLSLQMIIPPKGSGLRYAVGFVRSIWKLDLEPTWAGIAVHLAQKGLTCACDHPGLVQLLHIACYQGASSLVTILLTFGASVHAFSRPTIPSINYTYIEDHTWYGSAFHAAAHSLKVSIAEELIRHGANPCALSECSLSWSEESSRKKTPVEVALCSVQKENDCIKPFRKQGV